MKALPTLRQLQFFMTLARRGSFSKAADECLVSQSTLSSAVKELEGLIGQQLVDRSTRAFALTPAGEDVAARAPAILAATEDLVDAASDRRPLEGDFTLGVIPTIAPFVLPKATRKMHDAFPKLELYLREDLTAALAERLTAGLIDAALLAFPYAIPGVEVIDVGEDPFWFACSPDHPLASRAKMTTQDLSAVKLLLLEDGHCLREHALDACNLSQRGGASSFDGTSLFTLTQMARTGLGATLLPDMAIKNGLAKAAGLVAIPFKAPAPSRRIGVAWRKGSGRGDEAEAIADVIRSVLSP
ncbi:MAG: hydrogen peroxide-inducible genes activator [Pseudomonadota bacterium]